MPIVPQRQFEPLKERTELARVCYADQSNQLCHQKMVLGQMFQ